MSPKNRWLLFLAFLASGALALRLNSETLTLTTSYPAPSGVYQSIVTTGGSAASTVNTILDRDYGNVGVGTTSPNSSPPNGSANFNLDANDVYLRSRSEWASRMGFSHYAVFTANGNFTVPTGVYRILVKIWGGGGGGGGSGATGSATGVAGGGGGGGGYAEDIVAVTPGNVIALTVGVGGAGGAGGTSGGNGVSGGNGGASSFGSLTAGGGGGGSFGGGGSTCNCGGQGGGGGARGGSLGMRGSGGTMSGYPINNGGTGGSSGGGGGGGASGGGGGPSPGGDGDVGGGGGGGGNGPGAGGPGGNGGNGRVVIWY